VGRVHSIVCSQDTMAEKRREGGRFSTSQEEDRSKVVFVTDKLRLSGLQGTFIDLIFIGAVRVDEGVREETNFANGLELDLFLGVSGRGLSVIVVVSKQYGCILWRNPWTSGKLLLEQFLCNVTVVESVYVIISLSFYSRSTYLLTRSIYRRRPNPWKVSQYHGLNLPQF
jgi:hypothetical protein